jgi:hypothetical protein
MIYGGSKRNVLAVLVDKDLSETGT